MQTVWILRFAQDDVVKSIGAACAYRIGVRGAWAAAEIPLPLSFLHVLAYNRGAEVRAPLRNCGATR